MTGDRVAGRAPGRPERGKLGRDRLTPGRLEYRIWRSREDGGILEHRVVVHAPLDLEAFRIDADPEDGDPDVAVVSLGRFDSLDAALRARPELVDVGPDSVDTAIAVRRTRFGRVAKALAGGAEVVELNGWEVERCDGGWFPPEGADRIAMALADDLYPGGGRATFLLRCEDLFAVKVEGDEPKLLAAQTVEDAMADFLANHVWEGEAVTSRYLPDGWGDEEEDDSDVEEDDSPADP